MWEIISSRDFLLNLGAGAVIFVLEVVLITALLPWFLQRRLDKRWAPVREAIAYAFEVSVAQYAGVMRMAAERSSRKDLGIESMDELLKGVHEDLLEKFSTYSAALTPELASRSADLLNTSRQIVRSASIEVGLGGKEGSTLVVATFKGYTEQVEALVREVQPTKRISPNGREAFKVFQNLIYEVRENGLYFDK